MAMEVLQQIRRAFSLPILCRDDQIPVLDSRKPGAKGGLGGSQVYRPLAKVKRTSPRRTNVKTWTRLMDNRPGTKVHPTIDEEEKVHIGGAHPSTPLGGSSLDLAPSLLSIYDSYATTNRSYSSCESSLHTSGVRDSERTPTHSGKAKNGYYLRDVNKNVSPSIVEGDSSDEEVVIDIEGAMAARPGGGPVAVSVTMPDSDTDSSCRYGPSSPLPADLRLHAGGGGVTLALDSVTDAKKRPLSISSTSSSTSSTSSLPRHQRKKVATCMPVSSLVGCGVGGGMDDGPGPLHMHTTTAALGTVTTMELHDVDEGDASAEEEDDDRLSRSGRDSFNSTHSGRFLSCKFPVDLSGSKSGESTSVEASPRSSCRLSVADVSGSCYVDRVVAEIIETERTYVCDLKDIIQGYLKYIDSSEDVDISDDDVAALFGNVEDIFRFNSEFLQCLEDCQADPVKIAQCFVDKSEGFLIYSDYCTNYPRSVEVLTKCMREPHLAEHFKQQQVTLKHGLPVGSYLLKPVQRILKYHLLLENIVNTYDKTSEDKDVFSAALSSMTKMAQYINEMKRKHEHAVRIQEIQSILYGWDGADLTTLGELALEDTFRMCGAKAQRNIFLFEKGILIAKKREDSNLLVKGFILCSNLMLIESIPKEPLSFHVIPFDNPRMQHTIQAKSLEQKRKWCHQIKKVILENYNAVIPDKAKELVMNMLGKSREEEGLNDSNLENIDPVKKQHTAPEYLERRRGRRRSTSLIPDFGLLKSKKTAKKSDGHSPKSSPRQRRKSDVTSFQIKTSPLVPANSMIHESLLESDAEYTEEVVLRDQNQRGRRKNRPLSRSLESLHLEMSLAKSDPPSTGDPGLLSEAGATSYDDASLRAKRMSKILSDEGLQAQLKADGSPWDQGMVSSVLGVSGVKEAEAGGAADGGDDVKDDGYCNVMFKDGSAGADSVTDSPRYSNVLCKSSPASPSSTSSASCTSPAMKFLHDSYGDYIKISTGGGQMTSSSDSDTSTYVRLYKSPELPDVIANHHAVGGGRSHQPNNSTDGCDGCGSHTTTGANTTSTPTSKDSIPCWARDRAAYSRTLSEPSPDGNADIGVYDNWQVGVCDNMLYADVSQQERLAGRRLSGPEASPGGGAHPAVRTTAYTECCRPVSPEAAVAARLDEPGDFDPWIPNPDFTPDEKPCAESRVCRKPPIGKKPMPTPKPTSLGTKRYVSSSFSQHDRPRRPAVMRSKPSLFRSNSFSSIDELDKCSTKGDDVKGHNRRRSDLLIFSNRSAFLASPEERTVKAEPGITRAIQRYATPPRDMGPEELLRDVRESQQRGRVVTRYATPPRELLEPAKLSVLVDSAVIENTYSCEFGAEVRAAYDKLTALSSPTREGERPATVSFDGSPIRGDLWSDIDEMMGKDRRSSSGAMSPASRTQSPQRPGSYHGDVHHSTTPSSKSQTPLSSPSSVLSNDSIVGSLKNAVMSLTHRITGRSGSRGVTASSAEHSPVRIARSSSIGAIDDTKVNSPSKSSTKDREKRKEKRHRFVYQLARAYSDRVKQRTKTVKKRARALEESEMFSTSTKELNNLLQENKQGGNTIGARIADEPCSSVIGTYTLQRQRHNKTKAPTGSAGDTAAAEAAGEGGIPPKHRPNSANSSNGHDSGCADDFHMYSGPDKATCRANVNTNVPTDEFTTLSVPCESLDNSCEGSDTNEPETASMDYYYEKKFMDDLEASLTDEVFRDSGMFCEEGGAARAAASAGEHQGMKISIKETVEMIEKKTRAKPVPKTEVKRGEKAQGIQEILKSLEKANAAEEARGGAAGEGGDSADDASPVKTVRDRTRELIECARLTRIRQDSCTVVADDAGVTFSDSSGTSTPTRRGWYTYRR